MPAGSEGTECGQRYPQRLSHYREKQNGLPRRREAVLFGAGPPGNCACGALTGFASFGRSLPELLRDQDDKFKTSRSAQAADGPDGGFSQDGIVACTPGFELWQEALFTAIAHDDSKVAHQSTALCSLYRRSSKLKVEFFC